LKSFRDFAPSKKYRTAAAVVILAAVCVVTTKGELPSWIRNIEAKTEIERAFFRAMRLPDGEILFRRPPAETRPALAELIQQKPGTAELYSLKALEDERQLDFAAAEQDWKLHAAKSANKPDAQLALVDFYHRRLRPKDEITALRTLGDAPPDASEKFTPTRAQHSWQAFQRILGVIQAQRLGKDSTIAAYRAWLARYPKEDQLYAPFLDFLVTQKEFLAANQLIADYQKKFPDDLIFAVKAKALVEYRQGSIQQGLSVYEKSFQPLWDPELVKSYFELLEQTHNLRKFVDEARAALNKNPEDLNAAARVFYYYQQQGKLEAAEQAVTTFRLHKEAAKSAWTPEELYACGRLLEDIHAYPEAARYYFALYNVKDKADWREGALTRLIDMLLTAPEAPIRLGTGELSMYKDIATMDQGPGYLNGILSLILNTSSPDSAYPEEEQRAVSYFHRSRAAELLVLLDRTVPNAEGRPDLHAKLLEFYADNAQSEAVLKGGKEFLAAFPKSTERTRVALLMADADARLRKTPDEFAIYDSVLEELASQADRMPLGNHVAGVQEYIPTSVNYQRNTNTDTKGEDATEPQNVLRTEQTPSAFQVKQNSTATEQGPRSPEYSRILERYLARLVELKEVPRALGVLRHEIDHNPDDPGLYERLAQFLQQNQLGKEEEEVYRRAMGRFADRSWYSKLARLYLRYKKNAEFEQLSQEAIKQFSGSELETYFQSARANTPEMYLHLNQYANGRFPHNPYFVRNLLEAYHSKPTYDDAAWLALLRQHWFEDSNLRNQYFYYLSSTLQLPQELAALQKSSPSGDKSDWSQYAKSNPAAAVEIADAQIWRSHFEESAPVLKTLAEIYPAEHELDRTASSVYRSLAYFDPAKTAVAAKIENNLLSANPGDTEILARIGDIYSDRELFAQAAPYWERIPKVAPGESGGYLEAATIYWDYFDFTNALRLLDEGRKNLGNPTLYGYEEGAIYETQRDYSRAIHEYAAAALASGEDSPAMGRLLELARRPKTRDFANTETEKLPTDSHFSLPAVNLRVRVLEAEARKPELISFLESALNQVTTIEQAAEIESIAQQRSLETVRQKALEKQASLATDPVTRLQLRYALVRLYEARKDLASAQRNTEALYRDNPKILGVVRSTVDFYWRVKLYPQAIAVLRQAAKDAYPQLSKQFAFEAARKSTEAKDYPQARTLLADLLNDSPYDAQYLAAMADTYGQAGDAQGLKQFYLDKIALFKTAPFTGDERKNRIATLRRGLIPALTQLKEYSGGVDQYIELLNNFPEDEGLTTEAALYGLRHHYEKQLLDFYSKTVQQSPRDFRWPMVRARMQASLEDFPAAIDSYAKALTIRPDRTDLRTTRATLEERLQRFDDAVSDYDRLYQLAYKDPKWMEKIAEVRARQGRNADAVAALKTALIDVAPERASNYFEVARRLETWGILDSAKTFAEQGVKIAGDDLLASTEHHEGVKLYTRILTRLRQQDKAYTTLQAALKAASNTLPVLKQQAAKDATTVMPGSAQDKEWREHVIYTRQQNAQTGMRAALTQMGVTVSRYFTPEEKMAFAGFAQTVRSTQPPSQTNAIQLVHEAGLADLEAQWRYERMMSSPQNEPDLLNQMYEFVQLQRQRLKFAELGGQLEKFAPRVPPLSRPSVIQSAADAYRGAGDTDNELRLLLSMGYASASQNRLFSLLLKKHPQELVRFAALWPPSDPDGEAAASYAIANGDPDLAQAVVASRSRKRPPVWNRSYAALVGLYFNDSRPEINAAFVSALGDLSVADRLGKLVNRDQQLAGDIWFYYASRYGEYLGDTKQLSPEDFLPAQLERSPASADGYQALGDFYLDKANAHQAIEQYKYTLELAPGHTDVLDKLAMAYYRDGNRTQAIAEWKRVFATQLNQVNNARLSESFWADFGRACDHVRTRHLLAEVKPDVDQLLRAYLHRNGNYRSNALLHSAYVAQPEPTTATAWLLDVSSAAQDPVTVLADVANAQWIPMANRGAIYQRILDAKQAQVAKTEGVEQEGAKSDLRNWQLGWVGYLVETKQYSQADTFISDLRKDQAWSGSAALIPYEMQCAARLGTLDAKIAEYKAEPSKAPDAQSLRTAARQLFEGGDKQSARKILEFVFARELEEHQLVATNFLGLAEIRIAVGDTPGAVALLNRLVLVVGDPYQNMDSAAALLEKTGHPAEAIAFLEPLAKSTPWEPTFRLRLAKAQIAAAQNNASAAQVVTAIAAAPQTPYGIRVQAASALGVSHSSGEFGSGELKLLAAGLKAIPPAVANQPFFYDVRLVAGQNSTDVRTKLDLLGKALADTPGRDDARIPFFRAATSVSNDELALASIDQILRSQSLRQLPNRYSGDEDIISTDEEEVSNEEEEQLPQTTTLQPSQQAQLAHEVALALIRLERLDEATSYLQAAQKLERSVAERKRITVQLQDVRARLRRQHANAARQPILHAGLEQDRLVRPRLVARATPPRKSQGKSGGQP
jgi:Flp pilus assembly protein TadD